MSHGGCGGVCLTKRFISYIAIAVGVTDSQAVLSGPRGLPGRALRDDKDVVEYPHAAGATSSAARFPTAILGPRGAELSASRFDTQQRLGPVPLN